MMTGSHFPSDCVPYLSRGGGAVGGGRKVRSNSGGGGSGGGSACRGRWAFSEKESDGLRNGAAGGKIDG